LHPLARDGTLDTATGDGLKPLGLHQRHALGLGILHHRGRQGVLRIAF
jgi:hypothetical protein